jgi:hypothetical protein
VNIIKKEMVELASTYVNGKMNRKLLIQKANQYYKLNTYHKEGIFFNLLGVLFEDPEDNELLVTRESIIRVLDNYIQKSISLEDLELWFWDVLNLNIQGNDSEEELIFYLLYLFDNLESNEITDNHMIEVNEILKSVSHAELALGKIKRIFGE